MKEKTSIRKLFYFKGIILNIIIFIVIGSLWVFYHWNNFRSSVQETRDQYMEMKKELIKNQVENLSFYIETKREALPNKIKQEIRKQAYEAHILAYNIYKNHHNKVSINTIKNIIKDALRKLPVNKNSYLYISAPNGRIVLYPPDREIEGKYIKQLNTEKAHIDFEEETQVIENLGEGYTSENGFTFVKFFEPFGWHIGVQADFSAYEEALKTEIIEISSKMRFGDEGYFFGYKVDGSPLFTLGEVRIGQANILNDKDSHGKEFIKQQVKEAVDGTDGFVNYFLRKLGEEKEFLKTSYVEFIEGWNWVIGSGTYIDEVEALVAEKELELRANIKRHIFRFFLILISALILDLLILRVLLARINQNLEHFRGDFFLKGGYLKKVESGKIDLQEFNSLAAGINNNIDLHNSSYQKLIQDSQNYMDAFSHSPCALIALDCSDILQTGLKGNELSGKIVDLIKIKQINHAGKVLLSGLSSEPYDTFVKDKIIKANDALISDITMSLSKTPPKKGTLIEITDKDRYDKLVKINLSTLTGANHDIIVMMLSDYTLETELYENFECVNKEYEIFTSLLPMLVVKIIPESSNILYANPAFCKYAGLPHNQFKGRNFLSIFTAKDKVNAEKAIRDISNQLTTESNMKAFLQLGENKHLYSFEFHAIKGPKSKKTEILVIGHNITELSKTESQYQAIKTRQDLLLSLVYDGIVLVAKDGGICDINDAAEMMLGYKKSGLLGKTFSEIFNRENSSTFINQIEDSLKNGNTFTHTEPLKLQPDSGAEQFVILTCSPVPDIDGKITGAIIILRDITKKTKLESEIKKHKELESLGSLAGGIAHDFNNLLTAVLGNISYLKQYIYESDPKYRRLADAENAALRAKDLTDKLLRFSKDSDRSKEATYLRNLIKDTAKFLLSGSNIKPEFEIENELLPVEISESNICQVLNNILINARQAMPDGGEIILSAGNQDVDSGNSYKASPGRYVEIIIKDKGIGITRENLSKIFEPYFSTKPNHVGLGLSSVDSIVSSHGGYIKAYSTPGEGAEFHILLPEAKINAALRPTKKAKSASRGKILVMDDEMLIRDIACEMLKSLNYETDFAENGEQMLEKFSNAMEINDPFDVVIMDLTIPGGMGGKQAVKELLEKYPDAVAIVSSGYANDPVMSDHRAYGFKAVIAKPYTIKELATTLQTVLL